MNKINTGMKKLLFFFLLAFSMQVFAQTPDPNFHIYLSLGQSNMEGQGTIENQDKTVDSRFVQMYSQACSGRTLAAWGPAVPPLAGCNFGLGPTDYFGRTMVKNLPSNIKVGVIVVAVAGCKIELFDKVNYQTYANSVEQYMKDRIAAYGGNPYGRLVTLAKEAQKQGVIKGILLHQGESNTGDQQWANKVKAVYNNLLTDLGLTAANVPLLAGEVVGADQGGQCASMNSIIGTLPNTIPTSYVISSVGCTDVADNLHFSSAGYRLLGERYATKMLTLLPAAPTGYPEVNITAPTATSAFSAPATITITANATDSNGSIAKVEFYNGTTKLGEDASSPYSYSWTDVAAGSYSITAKATDNAGNSTTSAAIAVKVRGSYKGTPFAIPGTIQFEEFDFGGNEVAYYDNSAGSSVTPTVNFRTTEDVDIENCTDAGTGYNIGYAVATEWLEYTVNVASAGIYTLKLRVACEGTGRTVSLTAKGVSIANNVAIPNTGGWQTWQDLTVPNVSLTAGVQVIRLTIGATDYVNLNYMTFSSTNTATPTPTVNTPVTYCIESSAIALTASGTALKWYTAATGGTGSATAPIPSTATVGEISYYVTQTIDGVESERAAIVVKVVASPAKPVVNSSVNYMKNEVAVPLTATGTNLKWYTTETGGTGTTTAPTPSTTVGYSVSYYVSQSVGSCESPRAKIVVNIIATSVIKISLRKGWNMIGYPYTTSMTIEEAFANIMSELEVVKNFDGFWNAGGTPILNSLTKLDWGKGYLVKVNAACEIEWEVK
ncbi:MAG: carbohydrate-binding protein [Bacteroidales bacterium]|nr:carbohydrate-binding protein [Bacteroidales bacterium]